MHRLRSKQNVSVCVCVKERNFVFVSIVLRREKIGKIEKHSCEE